MAKGKTIQEHHLEPCPFCGAKAVLIGMPTEAPRFFWVRCRRCWSSSRPTFTRAGNAVRAWNRRSKKKR
ncbi:Lar family restriction alleviation protein [Myxococcota bacterium]